MTVPKRFWRNSDIPGILVLHHRDLPEADVQIGPGYKYTRPLRTILDLIEIGTIEPTHTIHALRQAVERGLITHQQLQDTALSEAARKVVEEALRQAEADAARDRAQVVVFAHQAGLVRGGRAVPIAPL